MSFVAKFDIQASKGEMLGHFLHFNAAPVICRISLSDYKEAPGARAIRA